MNLIVITTESFFEGEVEAINLLFDNGLDMLHVRKPYASQQETGAFIGQINKNFHSRMVLHDYYELTKKFDLKGIHLNRRNQDPFTEAFQKTFHKHHCKEDNPKPSLRGTKQSKLTISRSCHSLEELLESQSCDYVLLSPIFNSISKSDYKQAFTTEQLNEAKDRKIIDERVIALGGITVENIPVACTYGFGGVAVLGALWSGFTADRKVNELLERFNDLNFKCHTA